MSHDRKSPNGKPFIKRTSTLFSMGQRAFPLNKKSNQIKFETNYLAKLKPIRLDHTMVLIRVTANYIDCMQVQGFCKQWKRVT